MDCCALLLRDTITCHFPQQTFGLAAGGCWGDSSTHPTPAWLGRSCVLRLAAWGSHGDKEGEGETDRSCARVRQTVRPPWPVWPSLVTPKATKAGVADQMAAKCQFTIRPRIARAIRKRVGRVCPHPSPIPHHMLDRIHQQRSWNWGDPRCPLVTRDCPLPMGTPRWTAWHGEGPRCRLGWGKAWEWRQGKAAQWLGCFSETGEEAAWKRWKGCKARPGRPLVVISGSDALVGVRPWPA